MVEWMLESGCWRVDAGEWMLESGAMSYFAQRLKMRLQKIGSPLEISYERSHLEALRLSLFSAAM
jgi:hypothetical protein